MQPQQDDYVTNEAPVALGGFQSSLRSMDTSHRPVVSEGGQPFDASEHHALSRDHADNIIFILWQTMLRCKIVLVGESANPRSLKEMVQLLS